MLGISWVATQLAASQEGLSSMSEWVSETLNDGECLRSASTEMETNTVLQYDAEVIKIVVSKLFI
jgi:hypothetical protein